LTTRDGVRTAFTTAADELAAAIDAQLAVNSASWEWWAAFDLVSARSNGGA
jgi:hypothetical protein